MNGPFFSERAIVSPFLYPYSSTRRSLTHCARRSLRNPRTGPGHAVRNRAERAHKPRALRVRRLLHHHRPAGLAQPVQHLHRNCRRKAVPRASPPALRAASPPDALRAPASACARPARRRLVVLLVACAHHGCLNLLSNTRRARLSILRLLRCPESVLLPKLAYGLRRSHNHASLRALVARVFAPSVGKPHGVCG